MNALLQKIPVFTGLDNDARKLLLERAEKLEFPAGAVITREGENGNRLYVIDKGAVRVFKNFGQPNQVELASLKEKEFFGEMCILDTLPRIGTVQAAEPTVVIAIPAASLHHLYRQMPAQYSIVLLNLARDLSRRLRHLDEIYASRA